MRCAGIIVVLMVFCSSFVSTWAKRPPSEPESGEEAESDAVEGCKEPPSEPATTQAIRQTIAALRHIHAETDMSDIVFEPACPLLTTLKHQLRDFMLSLLNSAQPAPV